MKALTYEPYLNSVEVAVRWSVVVPHEVYMNCGFFPNGLSSPIYDFIIMRDDIQGNIFYAINWSLSCSYK